VALHVADGKNETNLPAGGCHLRLEAADAIAGGAVTVVELNTGGIVAYRKADGSKRRTNY
jgi:hypothetical protein